MSFTDDVLVTLGPFRPSLMSRRKTERFWVNRSLFLVNRFRSMPSIRLSNQVIMEPRLSLGCEEITWSRKFWKWIGRLQEYDRKIRWDDAYRRPLAPSHLKVVLIKQYQPQEGPWHGPLVATVLEHNDVQDSLQHLLEDLWPHLDNGHQRVVVGVGLSRAARLLA